jgi:hypothetical protein
MDRSSECHGQQFRRFRRNRHSCQWEPLFGQSDQDYWREDRTYAGFLPNWMSAIAINSVWRSFVSVVPPVQQGILADNDSIDNDSMIAELC